MNEKQQKEFETLLESIKTPSNIPVEQQEQLVKPICDLVETLLPSRVYRFRQCSERHIDAFYKDQVWVSRGIDMNDDYDSCLFYDQKKIDNWFRPLDDMQFFDSMFEYVNMAGDVPDIIKAIIPDSEKNFGMMKQLSKENFYELLYQFKQYIKDNLPEKMNLITELIQKGVKFACFSENVGSSLMWGYYSGNGTGFALGYDFGKGTLSYYPNCNKLGKECVFPMLCHIYPVIYKNERYDATEYALYMFRYWLFSDFLGKCGVTDTSQWTNIILPCPDTSLVSKIAIRKSLEWKPEKEWRMFCSSQRPDFFNEAHSFVGKKATAIYLGRNISEINEKILKDIAKEKGIECYKMQIDNRSSKYRLKPVKLEL